MKFKLNDVVITGQGHIGHITSIDDSIYPLFVTFNYGTRAYTEAGRFFEIVTDRDIVSILDKDNNYLIKLVL